MFKLKRVFLSLWTIVDPIYYAFSNLTYVEPATSQASSCEKNVFRVRTLRYRGESLKLEDGTVIKKNDLLMKIHLHNIMLLKDLLIINSHVVKARNLYRMIEQSMPGLAQYIKNHPQCSEIRGIMGITTLNRGCKELGFEVFPIEHELYKLFKATTLLPIHMITHPQPFKMIEKHVPCYLVMSKFNLFKLYDPINYR